MRIWETPGANQQICNNLGSDPPEMLLQTWFEQRVSLTSIPVLERGFLTHCRALRRRWQSAIRRASTTSSSTPGSTTRTLARRSTCAPSCACAAGCVSCAVALCWVERRSTLLSKLPSASRLQMCSSTHRRTWFPCRGQSHSSTDALPQDVGKYVPLTQRLCLCRDLATFRRVFEVNVIGAFASIQALYPLVKVGTSRRSNLYLIVDCLTIIQSSFAASLAGESCSQFLA